MTFQQTFAVASLSTLVGCGLIGNYQNIYFYPVNQENLSQALKGTIYNLSGKIKLTSPKGEEYTGDLFRPGRPQDPSDSLYSMELEFPRNWDQVYGDSYFSKHILGSSGCSRGKLVSSSGAFIYVEIIRPNPKSNERLGVAIDNNRLIYKITF